MLYICAVVDRSSCPDADLVSFYYVMCIDMNFCLLATYKNMQKWTVIVFQNRVLTIYCLLGVFISLYTYNKLSGKDFLNV